MRQSLFPLEDFGADAQRAAVHNPTPAAHATAPSTEDIEVQRVAAYEQGYQAGWDDALSAESADQSRIGAEFSRNLQDLGFTFHEARSHVMSALEPLLSEMVSKVLPRLVSDTLGQTIIEELMPFAQDASDTPVQIVVSLGNRKLIEALFDESLTIPIDIVEEPTLADGQVFLRLGELEKKIDMESAIERIGRAIKSTYALNKEVMKHG